MYVNLNFGYKEKETENGCLPSPVSAATADNHSNQCYQGHTTDHWHLHKTDLIGRHWGKCFFLLLTGVMSGHNHYSNYSADINCIIMC